MELDCGESRRGALTTRSVGPSCLDGFVWVSCDHEIFPTVVEQIVDMVVGVIQEQLPRYILYQPGHRVTD